MKLLSWSMSPMVSSRVATRTDVESEARMIGLLTRDPLVSQEVERPETRSRELHCDEKSLKSETIGYSA